MNESNIRGIKNQTINYSTPQRTNKIQFKTNLHKVMARYQSNHINQVKTKTEMNIRKLNQSKSM